MSKELFEKLKDTKKANFCGVSIGREYEKGIESINFCLSIQETGSFNWFKTHEIHLSLCFHTQEYQKAWEIYQHTTKHKLFVKLPPNVREPWKIYEALSGF